MIEEWQISVPSMYVRVIFSGTSIIIIVDELTNLCNLFYVNIYAIFINFSLIQLHESVQTTWDLGGDMHRVDDDDRRNKFIDC